MPIWLEQPHGSRLATQHWRKLGRQLIFKKKLYNHCIPPIPPIKIGDEFERGVQTSHPHRELCSDRLAKDGAVDFRWKEKKSGVHTLSRLFWLDADKGPRITNIWYMRWRAWWLVWPAGRTGLTVDVFVNHFTPMSDQFQISPAASPEIVRHTVWRTWVFIAYSDERWLYYQ